MLEFVHNHMQPQTCEAHSCPVGDDRYLDGIHHFVGAKVITWPVEDLTGAEWAQYFGAKILDPDGWDRTTDEFDTLKISKEEFDKRVRMCTIDMRGYPTFVKV